MDSQDRRSFTTFPGSRINITDEGISTSLSAAALRMSLCARGFAKSEGMTTPPRELPHIVADGAEDDTFGPEPDRDSGHSHPSRTDASVPSDYRELTSPGCASFKEALVAMIRSRTALAGRIAEARAGQSRFSSEIWHRENRAAELKVGDADTLWKEAAAASARIAELEEEMTRLTVDPAPFFPVAEKTLELYERVCRSFALFASNSVVWNVASKNDPHRVLGGIVEFGEIERRRAILREDKFGAVRSLWNVPRFEKADGSDIFVYPSFLLHFTGSLHLSVVALEEICAQSRETPFVENGPIPPGAVTTGRMQHDSAGEGGGGELPVCRYATIRFTSGGGLDETFLASNASAADAFCNDFAALAASLVNGT
jgi:hypothetical protein